MRRILVMVIFTIVSITSLFSRENNVSLNTSIDEAPLEYELYRKLDNNLTLIEDGSVYIIDNLNDLSTNTMITDFTIRVNSNLNSSKSVNVNITPGTFKTFLNDTQVYDSKIKPIINTIINRKVVNPGLNVNKEVYRFNIFVCGRKNLPAGKYICNVNVEYSIE